MTPQSAGELCDEVDKALRGTDVNLTVLVGSLMAVIREEAWRERRIRTGEVVRCESFLELLTAPPLHGFGEDPAKVEALLRDDLDALRIFREATTGAPHKHRPEGDNVTVIEPERGNGRAYTLDRLHRQSPELYSRVVAGELSPNRAAIEAGFRRRSVTLQLSVDSFVRAARKHFSDDEIAVLISMLMVGGGGVVDETRHS